MRHRDILGRARAKPGRRASDGGTLVAIPTIVEADLAMSAPPEPEHPA